MKGEEEGVTLIRIAIVGSRDYPDLQAVRDYVSGLPKDTLIVSGGARGVDSTAETTARAEGLQVMSIRPNWSEGRGAGLARNTHIVENADAVVAFWDGVSRGTADTIAKARAKGIPVTVIETRRASAGRV